MAVSPAPPPPPPALAAVQTPAATAVEIPRDGIDESESVLPPMTVATLARRGSAAKTDGVPGAIGKPRVGGEGGRVAGVVGGVVEGWRGRGCAPIAAAAAAGDSAIGRRSPSAAAARTVGGDDVEWLRRRVAACSAIAGTTADLPATADVAAGPAAAAVAWDFAATPLSGSGCGGGGEVLTALSSCEGNADVVGCKG